MPTESQLKAQMQAAIAAKKLASAEPRSDASNGASQAAIAKKKQASVATRSDVPEDTEKTDVSNGTSASPAPKEEKRTVHPALYQPILTEATQNTSKVTDESFQATEAELTRTFFGRPIRVAISKKQVYFCVPDVLETSDGPEQQLKYSELRQESDAGKVIGPVVKTMIFPSPGGASEKLDSATAEDIIMIISKLKLTFPGPIEHWLTDTTKSLMILIG